METQEDGDLCFPQLLNASCRKPVRPQHEVMLTYVLLSSISLLTTALNLAVIVSIAHFKYIHSFVFLPAKDVGSAAPVISCNVTDD